MLQLCTFWCDFLAHFGTLCHFLAFFCTILVFWAFYAVLSRFRFFVIYALFWLIIFWLNLCLCKKIVCPPLPSPTPPNMDPIKYALSKSLVLSTVFMLCISVLSLSALLSLSGCWLLLVHPLFVYRDDILNRGN